MSASFRTAGRRPDVTTQEHVLFVTGKSSLTSAAVRAVSEVAPAMRSHGIGVAVVRVRPKDLRNPRVLAAFRRRGVGNLPAALVGGRPLVGVAAIREYYRGLMSRLSEAAVQREVAQEVASRRRRRPPSSTGYSRQGPMEESEVAGMVATRVDRVTHGERPRHGSALSEIETRGAGDSVDLDVGMDDNALHDYLSDEIRAAPPADDDNGA